MSWYILQVYAGSETKVVESIQDLALKTGFDKNIEEVLVPTQDVTQVRYGKKIIVKKKFLPGYILLNMNLTEDLYRLIKSIQRVSGFVGASKDELPFPVSQAEIDKMINITSNSEKTPIVSDIHFEVGENISIISGPFSSFKGVIEVVEEERRKLKVAVSIFGRLTPVELEYHQVEKDN
jgi:transcriptional antiterminator NusG